MKKSLLLAALTVCFPLAHATEGGGDTYPLGAEGYMAGVMPPAGVYLVTYYQNYPADKFVNENGDSVVPGFDVEANAVVPRLVWMTDKKVLNGQLGFYAVQPLVNLDVKAAGANDSETGFGDLAIAPMLSWHNGNHHWAAAFENSLPTGDYKKGKLANIGKNYYTARPIVAYAYHQPNGWDLSTKMSYSINSENDDTNYDSGDYLAGDYAVSYQVAPAWNVGIQGYVFKQLTDDKDNGVNVGNRGQSIAVGPAVQYQGKGWSLEGKYLTETNVKNRAEGDSAWLKAVWSF
jgi:hypothetical protein